MYRRDAKGWLKHLDFMVLDLIVLQIAFVLSFVIRMHRLGFWNPYAMPVYANMSVFLTLCDLVVMFCTEPFRNVLKRGYYLEFSAILQQALFLELLSVLFLFLQQTGEAYSRTVMFLTGVLYVVIGYPLRLLWKKFIRSTLREGNRSLLIVTTRAEVEETLKGIQEFNYGTFRLTGLVLVDEDLTGQEIAGVPVVASASSAPAFVQKTWVDEVFVSLPRDVPFPQTLVNDFAEMGVTIHVNLSDISSIPGTKQLVEKLGNYSVLTSTKNYLTTKQAFLKRSMDIAGGLVGCLFTAVLFLFVAPAIYISSPGPIFFSQERIGKNGRRFKMYKFRSMYPDAEERKKELMAQNKMDSDLMFKMDFDPRIIGNRILPDGTKKTGIGQFIRNTSIDEFPQFFNVLKGDMSLVGTRPPLVSEFDAYDMHHRARMSVKPGITGMWQVSGRSKITDFEEVVRLDTQYINNWSLGLDIKILVKTVIAVIRRKGSM